MEENEGVVEEGQEDLDADLEKILNERTSALTKGPAGEVEQEKDESLSDSCSETESDTDHQMHSKQKRKKKSVFKKPGFNHVFDSYLLKVIEKEMMVSEANWSAKESVYCANHQENASRDCFECSLINLISI